MIDGFSISHYRSFGKVTQKIGPLSKLNLFAGQNNSGKSNILRYTHEHLKKIYESVRANAGNIELSSDPLDSPIGVATRLSTIYLAIVKNSPTCKVILSRRKDKISDSDQRLLETLIFSPMTSIDGITSWLKFEKMEDERFRINGDFSKQVFDSLKGRAFNREDIQRLCLAVTGSQMRDALQSLAKILESVSPSSVEVPNVILIPNHRRVEGSEISTERLQGNSQKQQQNNQQSIYHNGSGLISKLMVLTNPTAPEYVNNISLFNGINDFLRTVLDDQTVAITIPHDLKTINIHMNGRVLPLTHVGSGLEQLVVMAYAATVLQNHIICIEEPELHFHPVIQRRLLKCLHETNNQYFITTHSAQLLDADLSTIFHVTIDAEGFTNVQLAVDQHSKHNVVFDLGYRPSDLLQANCVIWVEGPSDRIYINHWIRGIDASLIALCAIMDETTSFKRLT